MSTSASEINEQTTKRRTRAAKPQSEVDLEAQRKADAELTESIVNWRDAIIAAREERETHMEAAKACTSLVTTILKEAKSHGILPKTFKLKIDQWQMDESKRLSEEATARRVDRAFGWNYEQLEFFPADESSTKPNTLDEQDGADSARH